MAGKETETEDQGKSEKKKKSPLIKIIVLVVLLAVLGGGGFFGYVKFLKKEPPPKEPEVEQSVSAEGGSFLVNLSDPGGKRYLKVSLQFELSGKKVNDEINRRNVEMRDMIIMLLSSKEYTEIGNATGKLTLKRELMTRLNKMLRDGQVKEIYFTEFLVQ